MVALKRVYDHTSIGGGDMMDRQESMQNMGRDWKSIQVTWLE